MTDAQLEITGSRQADARASVSRPDGLCVRSAELRSLRAETREVDFICSTDSVDSYSEVVAQNWDLKRFATNPVALFGHDARALPIGQWKDVRVESGALVGTLKVASAAANPLAENVWHSLVEGTLRAVSVGFWPHKISVEEVDGVERCVLDDNELFEISVVPIPANADAIGKMRAKAIEEHRAQKAAHVEPIVELGAVPYEPTTPDASSKWDHSNALKAIRKWASSDGSGDIKHVDWSKYAKAFAWRDPNRAHEVGGYKLPHHTVKGGKLVVVKGGVEAAGAAIDGARGGVKIPAGDVGAVKAHLAKHYRQFDMTPPWEAEKNTSAPLGASKGTPIMATKDDSEEMGMIECPKCGESFEPPKGKKHAELQQRALESDNKRLEAEAFVAKAKADLETARAGETALKAQLEAANKAALEMQAKLFAADLEPLVGTKMAPAERDGVLEIAKLFATQGEAGSARWKAHLDGIKSRPDMSQKTGGSVIPSEPEGGTLRGSPSLGIPGPAILGAVQDPAGAELATLVNQRSSN